MTIFHYAVLPVNDNFAAGLNFPPAASRPVEVSTVPTVFARTRDDEPSDADRVEWAFRLEIAAANAEFERLAAEAEAAAIIGAGYAAF